MMAAERLIEGRIDSQPKVQLINLKFNISN